MWQRPSAVAQRDGILTWLALGSAVQSGFPAVTLKCAQLFERRKDSVSDHSVSNELVNNEAVDKKKKNRAWMDRRQGKAKEELTKRQVAGRERDRQTDRDRERQRQRTSVCVCVRVCVCVLSLIHI